MPLCTWEKIFCITEVTLRALNVTSVIQNIFSQVQRGTYSVVQFQVKKSGNEYHVSSNGMGIERFSDLVRDKYSGSTLNPFHDFTKRCSSLEVNPVSYTHLRAHET